MITINIFNILILVLGMIIIWVVIPYEYKEELGTLVGWTIEAIWIIAWIIIFPILGGNLDISFTFK